VTDTVFPENMTPEGRARIESIAIFRGMMRVLPTIIEMDWDKVVITLESARGKTTRTRCARLPPRRRSTDATEEAHPASRTEEDCRQAIRTVF
jgi:hypothetical protein